jgi:hypothetical protein
MSGKPIYAGLLGDYVGKEFPERGSPRAVKEFVTDALCDIVDSKLGQTLDYVPSDSDISIEFGPGRRIMLSEYKNAGKVIRAYNNLGSNQELRDELLKSHFSHFQLDNLTLRTQSFEIELSPSKFGRDYMKITLYPIVLEGWRQRLVSEKTSMTVHEEFGDKNRIKSLCEDLEMAARAIGFENAGIDYVTDNEIILRPLNQDRKADGFTEDLIELIGRCGSPEVELTKKMIRRYGPRMKTEMGDSRPIGLPVYLNRMTSRYGSMKFEASLDKMLVGSTYDAMRDESKREPVSLEFAVEMMGDITREPKVWYGDVPDRAIPSISKIVVTPMIALPSAFIAGYYVSSLISDPTLSALAMGITSGCTALFMLYLVSKLIDRDYSRFERHSIDKIRKQHEKAEEKALKDKIFLEPVSS